MSQRRARMREGGPCFAARKHMKAVAQHADARMVDKRRERRSLGNVVQKVAFPASKRLDRDIDAIAVADIAGKAQKIRQLPPRGGEGKPSGTRREPPLPNTASPTPNACARANAPSR